MTKMIRFLLAFGIASAQNPPFGVKKVLILKISSLDVNYDDYNGTAAFQPYGISEGPPHLLIHQRSDASAWFGAMNSAASQTRDCSFNQLKLIPANDSPLIQDGVLNITIPINITDESFPRDTKYRYYDVRLSASQTALKVLDIDNFDNYDHVAFWFPPFVRHPDYPSTWGWTAYRNWAAFGRLNGKYTYFNGASAHNLAIIMHELGHNWGASHSGVGDDEYGDKSGNMGGTWGSSSLIGQYKCYNAAKSYQLGWYSNATLTLDPLNSSLTNSSTGMLVQFASLLHYSHLPENTLVNLHIQKDTTDIFMAYNERGGINDFTRNSDYDVDPYYKYGFLNQVNIVEADKPHGPFHDTGLSWRLAGIGIETFFTPDVLPSYTITNFSASERNLTFKFCQYGGIEYVTVALVSIHFDDQISACSGLTKPPTRKPTKWPTRKPTPRPTTQDPTFQPTAHMPTYAPTYKPTYVPTTYVPTTHVPTVPSKKKCKSKKLKKKKC